MSIRFGTTLANAMLVTGSLQSLLNSGHLRFFSGPVPPTADEAVDVSSAALLTVDNGGTGVTFQNTAANGVMTKTAAETWSGTIGTTGTAAFFRYCVGSDTGAGAAAAGNYRVQGTVGTDITADLLVATTNFVATNVITLSNAQLALPTT
jgi:hypothetical protein